MSYDTFDSASIRPFKPTTLRHLPWCFAWLAVVVAGALLAWFGKSQALHIVAGAVSFYGAQGLLAEYLGVRVTANAVSMPWRVANIPLATLWRKSASLDSIIDITSRTKKGAFERVVFRANAFASSLMIFPDRDSKLAFFDAVTSQRPRISIYRK